MAQEDGAWRSTAIGRMEEFSRDEWIQAFCLHMATVDSLAYDGAVIRVAAECWETSWTRDPADAVQRLVLERCLNERRRFRKSQR